MIKRYWQKGRKQKLVTVLITFILLFTLFITRDDYQPALLFMRKYLFIILVCGLVVWLGLHRFRRSASTGRRLGILALLTVFLGVVYAVGWYFGMYDYMKTWNVFNDLNRVEIHEMPLTQNERIQPFNNILTMAYESVGETQEISLPQLVRVDNTNKWTMAVQPAKEYIWQRISDETEEVFSVSSTTPFPRFSNENRIPVTFSIGESLKFSRNTYNAVVQRLNVFQLFTLEPSDVYYMKNDSGDWVQVVSLIRWKGFFFPYPTFGGVMVIESGKHDFMDYLERLLIGKGTHIPTEGMKEYPFLTGQNTLAERVSRLQAKSLKFMGGFSDPLPWNMKTAVKIPDLAADQNQQPFVTDFDFKDMGLDAYNGLYHWFGLEPVGEERTSLVYSVLIPADGTQVLYFYDHAAKKEGIAGVSAMPLKVKESRKEFDWEVNTPVEFRPYVKDIAGRKRMFLLSTVAAKNKDQSKFDGSATPDLALIDSEYRDVVWIDAKNPDSWDRTVYDQLNDAWRESEGIGQYYIKTTIDPDMSQSVIDSLEIIPLADKNKEQIDILQRKIDSLKALSDQQ
jgi:hypothetical protein